MSAVKFLWLSVIVYHLIPEITRRIWRSMTKYGVLSYLLKIICHINEVWRWMNPSTADIIQKSKQNLIISQSLRGSWWKISIWKQGHKGKVSGRMSFIQSSPFSLANFCFGILQWPRNRNPEYIGVLRFLPVSLLWSVVFT